MRNVGVNNRFIDYGVYHTAGSKVLAGEIDSLYDLERNIPGGFYYSFFFALFFSIFVLAGVVGNYAFFILMFLCYLKVLRFSFKLGCHLIAEQSVPSWVKVASVLLTTYAVNDTFYNANIGIFLLVLSIFAFELRNNKPLLTGSLLGVAIAFKQHGVVLFPDHCLFTYAFSLSTR